MNAKNSHMNRKQEVQEKLALIREAMRVAGAAHCRLRGTDFFAWATAGASNTVLLSAETGVAEVVVHASEAFVLTDQIEAQRLQDEELDGVLPVRAVPWGDSAAWEEAAACAGGLTSGDLTASNLTISDRPRAGEQALPPELWAAKARLSPAELERFREVGRLSAEAATEVLHQATPDMTEWALAGLGSAALRARGLEDCLVMVAGERRLPLYRHPIPQGEPIGGVAMLVFCARKYGLIASLTRFVAFRDLRPEEQAAHDAVLEVEGRVLAESRPGRSLSDLYGVLEGSYAALNRPDEITRHHQGGLAGYAGREGIATPTARERVTTQSVLAWNPSVRGAKIEDTIALTPTGLEVLTSDPRWPTRTHGGLSRPDILHRRLP